MWIQHGKGLPLCNPHIRSLQVTVLFLPVKSWPDWDVSNSCRSHREARTRGSLRPRNGETGGWIQAVGLTLLEQRRQEKPPWDQETSPGTGTPELLVGNFCTLCVDNSEREQLQEERVRELPPPCCAGDCREHNQVSTIYTGEKSPRASGRGRGAISVLNKARPQEKLVKQTLTRWGITRAYLTPGRNTPIPAHSRHPLPCKEERKKQTTTTTNNLRNPGDVQEPRPGFTKETNKKLWPNY